MAPSNDFLVPLETYDERTDLPAFLVTTKRGFLPRVDPPPHLPTEFDALESLLQRMPVRTQSGAPGLLATFELGNKVSHELPDLTDSIEQYKDNAIIVNALYRDYSFLASAYLLEPCHERHMAGEDYGLARDVLPASIARPIARAAELIGFKPFMEYAGSYALFNYCCVEPDQGLEYSNLRLIRAFENGLDPSSSEAGFVFVHVAMVKHSGLLVSGILDALNACSQSNNDQFSGGMEKAIAAMKDVNLVMDSMWTRSKPTQYNSFRTFIFGITSQTMFPDGVLYEGVSSERLSFRGESGANDSMIPLLDNFLQVKMPPTPLTEVLRDFRSYRPGNHREFLEWVNQRAQDVGLREFAQQSSAMSRFYLELLDQVREFRWRHWCFTREYILKQTKYSRATGGTPVVTWLPNQLQAVLETMIQAAAFCDRGAHVGHIIDRAEMQKKTLEKEVRKFCEERPSAAVA